MFNPIFKDNVQGRKHPQSCAFAEPGLRSNGWSEHSGQVTHICVGNLTIIGSGNGLSTGRRKAIIWAPDGILSIAPVGTKRSKVLSAKWRPLCLSRNVLIRHVTNNIIFTHISYICCYNFHLQHRLAWLACVILNETEAPCLLTTITLVTIQLQFVGQSHQQTFDRISCSIELRLFISFFMWTQFWTNVSSHTTANAHNFCCDSSIL